MVAEGVTQRWRRSGTRLVFDRRCREPRIQAVDGAPSQVVRLSWSDGGLLGPAGVWFYVNFLVSQSGIGQENSLVDLVRDRFLSLALILSDMRPSTFHVAYQLS